MWSRIVLFLIFCVFSLPAPAKVLASRHKLGQQHGLVFSDFLIAGPGRQVGATLMASVIVRNGSTKTIHLGRYGVFIAARDPADRNRDFAHNFRNRALRPGQKVKISGTLRIDKPGTWTFWPAFALPKIGWSEYQWQALRLNIPNRLVIRPPFAGCHGWKTSPGDLIKGSQARYWCNPRTGYIGINDTAFAGAAASEALQTFQFHSPRKQTVRIKAVFTYVGGAKTTGYGAFAGFQAVYRQGKHYHRKDIQSGLDYDVVAGKIRDLALLALPELTEVQSTKEALEILDTINSVNELGQLMWDLHKARKARTYTYTFKIKARKGLNTVAVGLRGNCSGLITGSSFVILATQLRKVIVEY